jgi:branched-chain amino acid transport system ATP-binding protein
MLGMSFYDGCANPGMDAAYLGGGNRTDYHAVKHYRRRRRWLA